MKKILLSAVILLSNNVFADNCELMLSALSKISESTLTINQNIARAESQFLQLNNDRIDGLKEVINNRIVLILEYTNRIIHQSESRGYIGSQQAAKVDLFFRLLSIQEKVPNKTISKFVAHSKTEEFKEILKNPAEIKSSDLYARFKALNIRTGPAER